MEEIIQKKLSIISILLLVVVGVGTFWVFNKGVFIPKENFVISDVPFIINVPLTLPYLHAVYNEKAASVWLPPILISMKESL